jgi:hypothetical protein
MDKRCSSPKYMYILDSNVYPVHYVFSEVTLDTVWEHSIRATGFKITQKYLGCKK